MLQLHGQCTRHNVNTQTEIVSLITLIKVTSLINSWLIELHTQRELGGSCDMDTEELTWAYVRQEAQAVMAK